MVYVPEKVWEQFYGPLVGSDAARQQFHARLVDAVQDESHPMSDPYARLSQEVTSVIEDASDGLDASMAIKEAIAENGPFGTDIAIAALRTVGNVYTNRARVPQQPDNVSDSAHRVVRHIVGVAFTDRHVGTLNVSSLALGLNPERRFAKVLSPPYAWWKIINPTIKVAKHSLRATTDKTGQVNVGPRFQRALPEGSRQCPATGARVEIAGRPRLALATLLREVTDVTVEGIYPHHFSISERE